MSRPAPRTGLHWRRGGRSRDGVSGREQLTPRVLTLPGEGRPDPGGPRAASANSPCAPWKEAFHTPRPWLPGLEAQASAGAHRSPCQPPAPSPPRTASSGLPPAPGRRRPRAPQAASRVLPLRSRRSATSLRGGPTRSPRGGCLTGGGDGTDSAATGRERAPVNFEN